MKLGFKSFSLLEGAVLPWSFSCALAQLLMCIRLSPGVSELTQAWPSELSMLVMKGADPSLLTDAELF